MPLRTTMIEKTTRLTSPPPLVFAVVMSPEAAPLIDPAVREWRADSRPIGVGTRFTIRGRLGWVPIRATSEVVVWEPPTVGEFRSIAPTWPLRMTARHRFEKLTEGGTEYTWSISFQEVNVVARPLVALATRLFRHALAAQAEMLSKYLDERSASEPLPEL